MGKQDVLSFTSGIFWEHDYSSPIPTCKFRYMACYMHIVYLPLVYLLVGEKKFISYYLYSRCISSRGHDA